VTHLGDRVTDLVDGQLGPEATESAHAHLAGCTPCREAVDAERLMKSRLAALGSPVPSGDLAARLLAIGGAPAEDGGPLRHGEPGGRVVRAAAGSSVPGRPVAARPAGARPAGRPDAVRPGGRLRTPQRRRLAAAVLGALSVVGVGAAGLTFSAASLSPATVLPPVATFVVERTSTTGDLPFVPAGWLGQDPAKDQDGATQAP
jgi:hypothetical protein